MASSVSRLETKVDAMIAAINNLTTTVAVMDERQRKFTEDIEDMTEQLAKQNGRVSWAVGKIWWIIGIGTVLIGGFAISLGVLINHITGTSN